MTKKKRHNAVEIAAKLGEADSLAADGKTQREIAQALGVSVMTFHRWRKARPQRLRSRTAGTPESNPAVPVADLSDAQRRTRIEELQLENTRLRRLVTDLLLEKMRLEEDAKNFRGRGAMKKA